jgi:predicted glycosyltransferase
VAHELEPRPRQATVWFDFENAPHVWVLEPLIEHVRRRGLSVVLTARDFSATVALCERRGHDVDVVGSGGGVSSAAGKAARILARAVKLRGRLRRLRPDLVLACSHGSRSQMVAARLMGVPALSLDDYEFSDQSLVRLLDHLLVPQPIPASAWGRSANKVTHYPGLKEELYLHRFRPEPGSIPELAGDQVKVLFRPESRFAHYRSERTSQIEAALLQAFVDSGLLVVLLPRDPAQGAALARRLEADGVDYWLPGRVLDGPALLWEMDLVLSGGGTMTREAAVLGIPSFSFFAGRIGAVDRYLEQRGRLQRITSVEDVRRLRFEKRPDAVPAATRDGLTSIEEFLDRVYLIR